VVEYEAISADNVRLGSELAFGAAYRPNYSFERASIILSLDSDFLGAETRGSPQRAGVHRRTAARKGRDESPLRVESA